MNCLILFPDEISPDGRAHLKGRRADEVAAKHDLTPKINILAGVQGGKLGHAEIESLKAGEVKLKIILERDPAPRLPISLIVAVPRPQSVKKIVQLSASIGIESLHFVRAFRSQKSYLQSKSLLAENIQAELINGLEQAVETIAPKVFVHNSFSQFMAESLGPELLTKPESGCFIADPSAKVSLLARETKLGAEFYYLALGPESGWAKQEVEAFSALGFRGVSLGQRMLRTEVAAAVLLGQTMFLCKNLS